MKIGGRGVRISLQLDDTGKKILRDADVQPEEALSAWVVDEDERGLWMRIERDETLYWLLMRWFWILSVEIPAPPMGQSGIRKG